MDRQPRHALPSFRLCPSCVAEAVVLLLGQEYVAGLELLGATSARRAFVGCCVNDKHCLEKLARNPPQSTRKLHKPMLVKPSFCVTVRAQVRASAAQVRPKDPIPGKGKYRTTPMSNGSQLGHVTAYLATSCQHGVGG